MLLIMALVVMTGCDNDGTEKLSCTNSTTAANGMVTTTNLEIKHVDDEIKYITLTRDYVTAEEADDRNNVDGTNTGTDGTAADNDARTRTNGTNDDNQTDMNDMTTDNNNDGTDNATTYNNDGNATDNNNNDNNNDNATTYNNTNNDNDLDADDIIDGAVGDVIDGAIGAVTDTILDISGVRDNYSNQITNFGNIPGFSSRVEVDNEDEYKVVYELDFEKMGDSDLERFNVSRSLATTRSYYENQGLTCQ